jgi:alanyl-tRNA synthetase
MMPAEHDTKPCSKCGIIKPLTSFNRAKKYRDGRMAQCRQCRKDYYRATIEDRKIAQAKYRQENRDTINAKQNAKRQEDLEAFRIAAREYQQKNSDRLSAHRKAYREKNKAQLAEYQAKWRKNHPLRTAAKNAVNNAIRAGKLERQSCQECGAPSADAHHPDYSKPFAVMWLCRSHHKIWHAENDVIYG